MHGIVTGTETRQTLYTILTRGRVENHVHVVLGTDEVPAGPLPWLAGIPDEVAASGWGCYLAARARRVSTLAASVRESATLPDWTLRYGDVLDPDLRGDLAVWRAARAIKPDDKSLTGPVPDDDREAAYHRRLNRTINARYGEAIGVWERKILDYTGTRDDQTPALAKQFDSLSRSGHTAERLLDLAAARKPLSVDHPTSARAYRIKELTTPKKRQVPQTIDPVSPPPSAAARLRVGDLTDFCLDRIGWQDTLQA